MFKFEPRGLRSQFWSYGSPVLALLLTIVTTGILFAVMGKSPGVAVFTFLVEPLLTATDLRRLAIKAAPLIMMGVGLSLCYRANVWNIGAEGQFTLGAIFGGGLALSFPDAPGWWLYPAVLLFGVLGGAVWAAMVAVLKTRYNANEILTSLMLTYVAQLVLIYLVTGPWRDPKGFGFPQTALFSDAATTPVLVEGTSIHLGCLVAPLVAIAVWLLMSNRCSASSSGLSARRRGPHALPASRRTG